MTFNYTPEVPQIVEEKPRDNNTIVVLDGDEIAFQIAAACEQRGIIVTNKSNEAQAPFKTRTQFKDLLSGISYPEDFFEIVDTQIAEDEKNAFATVKAKLMNYREKFNTDNIEIYLSGKGNFRDELLLPKKYKDNRKDALRPVLLQKVRDYLVNYQKAVVVNGMEADDMLSIRAHTGHKIVGNKIIAVTVDKDAMGYTGLIFNPDKMTEPKLIDGFGELYINEKDEVKGYGRVWTYFQILNGDPVDGYKPTDLVELVKGKKPRFGEKAVYKLLSACRNDKEAWQVIHDQFLSWFGNEKFSYTAWNGVEVITTYVDVIQMYFMCAKMLRWENDFPQVNDVLKKYGIIE